MFSTDTNFLWHFHSVVVWFHGDSWGTHKHKYPTGIFWMIRQMGIAMRCGCDPRQRLAPGWIGRLGHVAVFLLTRDRVSSYVPSPISPFAHSYTINENTWKLCCHFTIIGITFLFWGLGTLTLHSFLWLRNGKETALRHFNWLSPRQWSLDL